MGTVPGSIAAQAILCPEYKPLATRCVCMTAICRASKRVRCEWGAARAYSPFGTTMHPPIGYKKNVAIKQTNIFHLSMQFSPSYPPPLHKCFSCADEFLSEELHGAIPACYRAKMLISKDVSRKRRKRKIAKRKERPLGALFCLDESRLLLDLGNNTSTNGAATFADSEA